MAEAKKQNFIVRAWGAICRYFRELRSELKKVVWPTLPQVLKNTLIVAICVLAIGVFIWVFDYVAGLGIQELRDVVKNLLTAK